MLLLLHQYRHRLCGGRVWKILFFTHSVHHQCKTTRVYRAYDAMTRFFYALHFILFLFALSKLEILHFKQKRTNLVGDDTLIYIVSLPTSDEVQFIQRAKSRNKKWKARAKTFIHFRSPPPCYHTYTQCVRIMLTIVQSFTLPSRQ